MKQRSKNIERGSKSRKNMMRIMGPHGSGRYGYHDMKSSEALQDSDEDEDDYYEEDSHEKHHFYRQHHDER